MGNQLYKSTPIPLPPSDASGKAFKLWVDAVSDELNSLSQTVYNVREFGAKGDDTASDYTAIQSAISTAAQNGPATVFLPPGTYRLDRGLEVNHSVSLIGSGRSTVLKINNSTSPDNTVIRFESRSASTHATSAAAAVGSGQTAFTLNDVSGLAAGDTVMMLLGTDPWDSNEEFLRLFNKIDTIDGNTVFVRRGVPENVASSIHTFVKLQDVVDNVVVEDLAFDYVDGTTPDQTMKFKWCRNVLLRNLYGVRMAGAFQVTESENVHAQNIYSERANQLHASAGRVVGGWGMRNCSFRNVYGADIDAEGVFLESQCRGVRVENIELHSGDDADNTRNMMQVAGGCRDIYVRNYRFSSNLTRPSLRVTQESEVRTEDVYLYHGNKAFPLVNHSGLISSGKTAFTDRYRWTKLVKLQPDLSAQDVALLPNGIYAIARVLVSDTAELTSAFFISPPSNVNVTSALVADELVDLERDKDLVGVTRLGSDTPFNSATTNKRFRVTTTSSFPADGYALLDLEVYSNISSDNSARDVPLFEHDVLRNIQSISGSATMGNNLRGGGTVLNGSSTTDILFSNGAEPDNSYRIVLTPTSSIITGWAVTTKNTSGFTVTVASDPGANAAFDWLLVR